MKDKDCPPDLVGDTDDTEDVEILEVIGVESEATGHEQDLEGATASEPEDEADEYVLDFDDSDGAASSPDTDVAPSSSDGADFDRQALLRLRADYENLRKRIERERKDFEFYANYTLIGRLLPVVDNLDRALAVEGDTHTNGGLREGLVMIYRQLLDQLRREGLNPIDAVGQRFDPNLHDAVETEASERFPPQTVVEEFQKGYLFLDRVLRPAMVKVCTGHADSNEDG